MKTVEPEMMNLFVSGTLYERVSSDRAARSTRGRIGPVTRRVEWPFSRLQVVWHSVNVVGLSREISVFALRHNLFSLIVASVPLSWFCFLLDVNFLAIPLI